MQPEDTTYTTLLEASSISYTTDYPYLLAVPKALTHQWALHVSVIPAQMTSLMETLLPLLSEAGLLFSLPCNHLLHQQILDGLFGDGLIGQVINIYPASAEQALVLAKQLSAITKHYRGPAVPLCSNHGGCVYLSFRQPLRQKKLIGGRYLPVTIIKNDVKGRVLKCLDVSGWKHLRWVLVKEGLHDMCTDGAGRDIRDRLRWQYEILKALEDCRIAPGAFGFFEWEGNAYLAMEYIEGFTLHDVIDNIYRGRAHSMLSAAESAELHSLLLKVIVMVENLHAKGYVHRDLTPHNFIVTKTLELLFIDMELAFCINGGPAVPPFALGSRGYMSPEQEASAAPAIQEDIYGLGAMMMALFTGISPTRFDRTDKARLKQNLLFFTCNEVLADLITRCLDVEPFQRPSLNVIVSTLARMQGTDLLKNKASFLPGQTLMENALRGLCSQRFTDARQLWWSKENMSGGTAANENYRPIIDTGLYKGIAGIIYLFSISKKAGYEITNYSGVLEKNIAFIKTQPLPLSAELSPGNLWNIDDILPWWRSPRILPENELKRILQKAKKVKSPGLFHGRAGIALFLLNYAIRFKEEATCKGAEKILKNLLSDANAATRKLSPWFGDGFTGLAFVFIKAYETCPDMRWKCAAEQLLSLHPDKIISNAPEFATGLAGLGETYLEAYRVFGDEGWKERSDWIACFLQHTFFEQPDGSVYWQTGLSAIPSAGLMDGNAGIIHFLLRCENQNLPFPIFNTQP